MLPILTCYQHIKVQLDGALPKPVRRRPETASARILL